MTFVTVLECLGALVWVGVAALFIHLIRHSLIVAETDRLREDRDFWHQRFDEACALLEGLDERFEGPPDEPTWPRG